MAQAREKHRFPKMAIGKYHNSILNLLPQLVEVGQPNAMRP